MKKESIIFLVATMALLLPACAGSSPEKIEQERPSNGGQPATDPYQTGQTDPNQVQTDPNGQVPTTPGKSWKDAAGTTPPPGYQIVSNLSTVTLKDQNDQPIALVDYLEGTGKTKAVIQSLDGVCAGCIATCGRAASEVKTSHSQNTVYIVALYNPYGGTVDSGLLNSVKSQLPPDVVLLKDDNSSIANLFPGQKPPTITVDHNLYAKVANLHSNPNPAIVVTALQGLQ